MSFPRYAVERTAAAALVFLAVLFVIAVIYRVVPARVQPDRTVGAFFEAVLVDRDLGRSLDGANVGERAFDALHVTTSVVVGGLAAALLIGLALAVLPRGLGRAIGYLMIGSFVVWVGLGLAYWVGYRWSWTAISGYCWAFDAPHYFRDPATGRGPCDNDVGQWVRHLVLPWLTLGAALAPIYGRVLRVVLVARRAERGLEQTERKRRHRVRMLKVAKHAGRDFGFAIGLAVLVETVFGLPGLAEMAIDTVVAFDPVKGEGVLVVAALAAFTVHLAVDLMCGALEPELRRA